MTDSKPSQLSSMNFINGMNQDPFELAKDEAQRKSSAFFGSNK